MSARAFGLRLCLVYAFLFLGLGVQLPFLPLWLSGRALTETEIGAILSAMIAVRIFAAPLGTFIADRSGNRRVVVLTACAASFLLYLVMSQMDGFLLILVTGVLAQGFFSPVVPLVESIAVEGSHRHGLDYGRLRVWGSFSFIGASLLAGALLDRLPVSSIIFMIAIGQGLMSLASLALPKDAGEAHVSDRKRLTLRDAISLLSFPAFAVFIAAVSLGQSSHGLLYTFGSVHWEALGYSKPLIGILWGVSVATEIVFFIFSRRLARRSGPGHLILMGLIGAWVRWLLMAFDPPLWLLFACQGLHGLSFSTTHLGTMHYIQHHVPAQLRNTAQGVYAATSGELAMGLVMLASGPLYNGLGEHAYLIMAAMAGIGAVLALRLARVNPRALQVPET